MIHRRTRARTLVTTPLVVIRAAVEMDTPKMATYVTVTKLLNFYFLNVFFIIYA